MKVCTLIFRCAINQINLLMHNIGWKNHAYAHKRVLCCKISCGSCNQFYPDAHTSSMSYCISATSRQHAMYAMIPTDTFHVFSSGETASQRAITSASVSPLKACTHRLTKSCRFHCSVLLCGLLSTFCTAASRLTRGLLHVYHNRRLMRHSKP